MKADYGTYLTKQELAAPLAGSGLLAGASFLPLPRALKVGLRVLSGMAGALGLYTVYAAVAFNQDQAFKLQMRDALLDLLAWDGAGRALDIGAGAGLMSVGLAQRFPEASVVGCDVWSPDFVNLNQAKAERNAEIEGVSERVRFEVASAANLPYAYGEFDAVASNLVFHHVRDERSKLVLLMEALRVLKPGGAFVFNDIFLNRLYYPNFNYLVRALGETGLKSLDFFPLQKMVGIPPALLPGLGSAGILFGVK